MTIRKFVKKKDAWRPDVLPHWQESLWSTNLSESRDEIREKMKKDLRLLATVGSQGFALATLASSILVSRDIGFIECLKAIFGTFKIRTNIEAVKPILHSLRWLILAILIRKWLGSGAPTPFAFDDWKTA